MGVLFPTHQEKLAKKKKRLGALATKRKQSEQLARLDKSAQQELSKIHKAKAVSATGSFGVNIGKTLDALAKAGDRMNQSPGMLLGGQPRKKRKNKGPLEF